MQYNFTAVLLAAALTASGCLGQGPADAPTGAAEAVTAAPDWHEMDPNDRLNASAALADWDNSLLGVWIDSAGGLRVDTSDGTQWGAIPPISPGVRLATGTSPVIARIYDEAMIFVRGQDNNLYVNLNPLCTFFNPYGSCQTWRQLTTHGRVRGRFSVFLNQPSYNVPVRAAEAPRAGDREQRLKLGDRDGVHAGNTPEGDGTVKRRLTEHALPDDYWGFDTGRALSLAAGERPRREAPPYPRDR